MREDLLTYPAPFTERKDDRIFVRFFGNLVDGICHPFVFSSDPNTCDAVIRD
jgi:hypothetical protein